MKTRHCLTSLVLTASLLFLPFSAKSDGPPPEDDPNFLVYGCVAVAVGAVAIYVVWKCASKLNLPVVVVPPPPTNSTVMPTNSIPTNCPSCPKGRMASFQGSDDAVIEGDISDAGYLDPQGALYTTMWATMIESTTNFLSWRDECSITSYVSSAGRFIGYWTSGVPALCTYAPRSMITNYADFDLERGAPSKFFRLRRP